jgi:hypothetical protein
MEDAFSVFGLERRPLIDEAALKEILAARSDTPSGPVGRQ